MPNGVFNFRASWKLCSPDENEETKNCKFSRARGIPKARFHHCQWAPSLPACLKRENNAVKMEDKGGLSGVGMFVSITRRCQQGDRLEKYFLACQRRDPLTGLRHRKSCDSFHGLLSVFPFVTSLQSTFQQQCETDWSHYFILFNRLLPAPEGRSCIKPRVCNICCMGFWTTVFKRELYCKIHPLGLFHTLPLV